MQKWIRVVLVITISVISPILVLEAVFGKPNSDRVIGWGTNSDKAAEMPLVLNTDPNTASLKFSRPIEQRGAEFRKYLSVSVRINANGSSGSGTIVYHDKEKGWAYVASCGHLWNGSRSAAELERRPVKVSVTAWYHNTQKLNSKKTYDAQVVFWSNRRGYDSSLLKFKPDWAPNYFPIAPKDYRVTEGSRQHSLGCDGAREVAHYNVEIVGLRGMDLTTKLNSPRPGRSGGGLLSADGYYIGTCWGTSALDGSGVGYFTPLSSIRKVYRDNGYEWLLNISGGVLARKIPIYDWDFPSRKYKDSFIPVPGR